MLPAESHEMMDEARRNRALVNANSAMSDGDCEADPVPALWYLDDDAYAESGFIERFWLPLAIAVLAAWGSVSFVLFNAFGWIVILAIAGVIFAGVAGAVALVKAGDRNHVEMEAEGSESSEQSFRHVA